MRKKVNKRHSRSLVIDDEDEQQMIPKSAVLPKPKVSEKKTIYIDFNAPSSASPNKKKIRLSNA